MVYVNILAVILGSITGSLAGLLPGLHTNLLAIILASFALDPLFAALFLTSLAMARSVSDAIPSVFLGATEEQNVLAIFPGQQLLKQGRALDAVKFCLIGSLCGSLLGIICIPLFMYLFPFLFEVMRPFLFWFLLVLVIVLLFKDLWWSSIIFILAGILGLVAFRTTPQPLFPLLSGLFGASGLVLALSENTIIPPQEKSILNFNKIKTVIASTIGMLAGSLVMLFPGLSPSQSLALVQVRRLGSISYLIMVGALGTVDVLASLVTWYVAGKTRNGAVATLENIIGQINFQTFFALIAASAIALGLAIILTWYCAKGYAKLFDFINYQYLCIAVLLFLTTLSLILSGWRGLILLTTATALGLLAPLTNVSRTHAMGCLLLPTMLFLIPF